MTTLYDLDEVTMKVRAQGITLATLCDLVLGEDATNRSDEALIRAVGELMRESTPTAEEREEMECAGFGWENSTLVEWLRYSRQATRERAEEIIDWFVKACNEVEDDVTRLSWLQSLINEAKKHSAVISDGDEDAAWTCFREVQALHDDLLDAVKKVKP